MLNAKLISKNIFGTWTESCIVHPQATWQALIGSMNETSSLVRASHWAHLGVKRSAFLALKLWISVDGWKIKYAYFTSLICASAYKCVSGSVCNTFDLDFKNILDLNAITMDCNNMVFANLYPLEPDCSIFGKPKVHSRAERNYRVAFSMKILCKLDLRQGVQPQVGIQASTATGLTLSSPTWKGQCLLLECLSLY